jgi:chorismate synthase
VGSNTFGNILKITTFGESHGPCMGVVIDGFPAGLAIKKEEIQVELDKRKPGAFAYTSKRKEADNVDIVSGIFEGVTTGAPICLLIKNCDADSSKYEPIKGVFRPGHANFTYLEKYGVFDYRGGGRASARETVARVAAGAIAKKWISPIQIEAFIDEIGGEKDPELIEAKLKAAEAEGDSLGGVIGCAITNVPVGLGDPVYEKLEARLAFGILSIPATKGIEFGSGFQGSKMKGSEHNDSFCLDEKGGVTMESNFHGGVLGGISTGLPIFFRVAFKPTSSIRAPQNSVNTEKEKEVFQLPEGSRHDPCVALRATPIIEAMASLVIADALLMNRCSKIS